MKKEMSSIVSPVKKNLRFNYQVFLFAVNIPIVSISQDKYNISFHPGDKPGMQICIIG